MMVNPGSFRGSRKEFLMGEKLSYAVAVHGGYIADAVAKIQRRYLKRYPIDLPHDEEPTAEWLAEVNDDAPDPEPEELDKDKLSPEEYDHAMRRQRDRRELLDFRKGQIKRWLNSQYIKDTSAPPKNPASHNPYTTLLKQLIGCNVPRPRQKSATNVWRKPFKADIEAHLQGEIEMGRRLGKPVRKEDHAKIRNSLARELFSGLDMETQRRWQDIARNEHKRAMEDYNTQINADPSTEPEDRQMAIQGLVQFMQPILDRVCAATGWKVSVLAGGPEPANGGRLNMISIHSGHTSGDIKMTFGRAERVRYLKHVVPMFGNFLRMCYSPEECRSRALPDEEGLASMASIEPESDEATYHCIDEIQSMPSNTNSANTDATVSSTDTDPTSADIPGNACNSVAPMAETSVPTVAVAAPTRDQADHAAEGTKEPELRDETAAEINDHEEAMATEGPSSPTIDNPFPFEDCNATTSLYLDQSPQASPPPSPPASRIASPVPDLQPESDVGAKLPVSAKASTPHPSPEAPMPVETPTVALSSRDIGDPMNALSGSAINQRPLKRKSRDAAEVPIIEPAGSKRVRTKSTRAIAAEEQQQAKRIKGGAGKHANGRGGGGKENKGGAGKGNAMPSKTSRRKR